MTGVVVAVAKKKTASKLKPGPKPNPEGRRDAIFTMKCRSPFKQWMVGYAKTKRFTPALLVEMALVQMAKAEGYPDPPER